MSTSTPKFKVYGRSTALGAPIFITQEKTVDLTENGSVEIKPDEGHVLTNVKVNARVPFVDLPEDVFTLTGDCSYLFAGGGKQWWIDFLESYLTCRNITNISNMFQACTSDGFSFTIDCNCDEELNVTHHLMGSLFHGSSLKYAGTIKNAKPTYFHRAFAESKYLRYLPTFENCDYTFTHTIDANQSGNDDLVSFREMFKNCYSLREIPSNFLREMYCEKLKSNSTISSTLGYWGFLGCGSLDEIVGFSPKCYIYVSNAFNKTFDYCSRVKNIIFDTESDGTPYVTRMKSQSIDLCTYVGYAYSSAGPSSISGGYPTSYEITHYNSGITIDKRVTDATTYEALKDDPDWWTTDVNYSRYNHDSAVNTLNSLPDTSVYLAENGGTNTIKFKGASGSSTDGGAINTLTEEEIAVATAKGWTVSFA